MTAFIDGFLWEISYVERNHYFYVHDIYYHNSLTSTRYYPAPLTLIIAEEMIANITPELRERVINNIEKIRSEKIGIVKRDESPKVQHIFYLQEQLLP